MPKSDISKQIGHLALNTFDSLPKKCKPRVQPDGRQEWTPMSSVIVSRPRPVPPNHEADTSFEHDLKIVALATGTKSLPVSLLPKCEGLVLHDCHAEILTLRGFNYWLLCEMERMVEGSGYVSPWLELNTPSAEESCRLPFCFKPTVEVSLFSTEAPCGDASMELLMKAAEAAGQDVSPWAVPPAAGRPRDRNLETMLELESSEGLEHARLPPGRGYFSNLGALRRKPARADAEISVSKSCTDKLMLKQAIGLLSFPLDLFIEKTDAAYLKRMVVYHDQYNEEGYQRAFSAQGRLQRVLEQQDEVQSKYRFFQVNVLPEGFRRFDFQKIDGRSGSLIQEKKKPSNVPALWVAGGDGKDDVIEGLVNGVKQGYKQFDHRVSKASVVSRRRMLEKAIKIDQLLQKQGTRRRLPESLSLTTRYSEIKSMPERQQRGYLRQRTLSGLGGWPSKVLDDDFEITLPSSSIDNSCPLCSHLPLLPHPGYGNLADCLFVTSLST